MLSFPTETKNHAKCAVTHGIMGHLDPKQPPVKRKPYSSILSHHFVQKVELILPEEIYEIIKSNFFSDLANPAYSRVILPLRALVEGDFFTEYIKKGNILLLSEGRSGVDNVYSLREGILTLHLDKESYERAGLVGKPDGVKGKRGTRPCWVVQIDLRLPSMLHGKKAFDRIVYAFQHALTTPVTWLFCNLTTNNTVDPIKAHFPSHVICKPDISNPMRTSVPSLHPPGDSSSAYEGDFDDFANETHEWLSLVALESPRVDPDDKMDVYLSRYTAPGPSETSNLIKITWHGFISPSWAHKTFVQVLLAVPRKSWFAYTIGSFGEGWTGASKDCTILKIPDAPNEYMLWEVYQ